MGLPTDHAMTIAAQGSINDQKKKKTLKGFTTSAYSHQLCMFVVHCNTGCCQLKKKKSHQSPNFCYQETRLLQKINLHKIPLVFATNRLREEDQPLPSTN